jgi:hypothetical protein
MSRVQVAVRRVLVCLAVGCAAALVPAVASASITPSVTLSPGGTNAGSTVPFGMDLKFDPKGGDSPKDMTLTLPGGLLANASIDSGACLKTTAPVAACQVGSGTVTASLGGALPVALPVKFDLVAPPKPSDLAGLLVRLTALGQTQTLGSPGEITVRPASDPAGFGLNIVFTDLPNTFNGVSLSLDELNNSFAAMRLPTSCPATAPVVKVTADSYDSSTLETATAPLNITNCAALPFTPSFRLTAVRDAGDDGVTITTDITQPATPAQATSREVELAVPSSVLTPNAEAVLQGPLLCANPASGTCTPIGSASSASPLYPTKLTGKAFLTGSALAPGIAIVFPAPFALTLTGSVNASTNVTTFTGLPDIPLTDLNLTLFGGSSSAFYTNCAPPSGTATATLTSQNGDKTATSSSPFAVSGCPSKPPVKGKPRIISVAFSGLAGSAPSATVKLTAGTHAPKLKSLTVELPRGLSFTARGAHKTKVSLKGAMAASTSFAHGHLVITLKRAVAALSVQLRSLAESAALKSSAKHHHLKSLKLKVIVTNAAGKRTTLTVPVEV